jgi:ComF family protein
MLKYLKIILDLFYPRICVSCKTTMQQAEQHLCLDCLLTLPKTNSHSLPTELIDRKFWGKINVKNTYSYLRFNKKGKVQNILHALKYKNKPELAEYLGKLYGTELKTVNLQQDIDLILGIPLHKDKKIIRGYNQSDHFAKGLSEALNVPYDTEVIIRNTFTETQTKMANRLGRYKNIEGVFSVLDEAKIKNRRIALVDDILTTGSTLEVAGELLLKHGCTELTIITIASAY